VTTGTSEFSLLGKASNNTAGGAIAHGGVDGESAKNTISYQSGAHLRSDYVTIDNQTSAAIDELDTFRNGISKAELDAGEVPIPPSEIGERAAEGQPGYALSLLSLINETAVPDMYDGNLSDITIDGTNVSDRLIAPSEELKNYLNGSWDEGRTIDFSDSDMPDDAGLYIVDPESGQQDYVDSGQVRLRDAPNGDSSEYGSITIEPSNQTRTLSEFKEILQATENASKVDYTTSGTGFFPNGFPGGSTGILIVFVVLAAAVFFGGDS
jgi:hypothetical protein